MFGSERPEGGGFPGGGGPGGFQNFDPNEIFKEMFRGQNMEDIFAQAFS